MRVDIAASGRLKEPWWEAACAEYEKRLSRFCRLSVIETPENRPLRVTPGALTVALCVEGDMLSSEDFAEKLGRWANTGVSSLCFLIGGSDGLPEELKAAAGFKLSLSRMTWPHHMARAMLLEQVYRAFTILEGGKYHK